jgi:dynein light chain roadblock-type
VRVPPFGLLFSLSLTRASYSTVPSPPLYLQTSATEVEDIIKRIASHKGVEGILICNNDGVALKSTLTRELSSQYAGLFVQLIVKARGVVRTIDAEVCGVCGAVRARRCWRARARNTEDTNTRRGPPTSSPLPPSSSFPPSQDDLVFLRVRTKKHEVMVAPDKEYLLIVVQNPSAE